MCPSCKASLPLDIPESCPNCSAAFVKYDGYMDLTNEKPPSALSSFFSALVRSNWKQNFFRLSAVSHSYERGYRDGFKPFGFPGVTEEVDMLLQFTSPKSHQSILDLSCGSGLHTRKLAQSGAFETVIAADYSHSMLEECVARARKDQSAPEFGICRADVHSLPFVDGAFDAVHVGAALHCYPNVRDALAEIYRVIKPGGKLFATTFFDFGHYRYGKGAGKNDEISKWFAEEYEIPKQAEIVCSMVGYNFFIKEDLEILLKDAGFDATVEQMKGAAVVRAYKGED